jgi:proteasome lid subunit RPN8/RPN11
MACQPELTTTGDRLVLVRAAAPETNTLWKLLFRRYPDQEWATFARFGWRETSNGLVLTLTALDAPIPGELDESADHVVIREPYSLRVALAAEQHPFAVGVIHSHPAGFSTQPSWIDDDMDAYYASYLSGFAPDCPYVSLIFARDGDAYSGSGRVFWQGRWHTVERFAFERSHIAINGYRWPSRLTDQDLDKMARFSAAFTVEAAERLARSTVAVIGVGGTGSPVIEVLARAGVGHLIVVDPDVTSASNLERMHGSIPADAEQSVPKVVVAKRHVAQINPQCRVTAIQGAVPQPEVVDAVISADVILGCTDQQHSRLALNDLVVRYLIPGLDCGVTLEGEGGNVTGQVIQIVRFLAADACVWCRELVNGQRVAQELMSPEERVQRQAAADGAIAAGEDPAPYWQSTPQINTVGYLTTAAGGLTAGYAIGWLTGRFEPPFVRQQINLVGSAVDAVDWPQAPQPYCACRRMRGTADQGKADALISAPAHWPPVICHPE